MIFQTKFKLNPMNLNLAAKNKRSSLSADRGGDAGNDWRFLKFLEVGHFLEIQPPI
jgi:hypothetical protein